MKAIGAKYPQRYADGSWNWSHFRSKIEDYVDIESGEVTFGYACCADFVGMVLYYSGVLDAETINSYNFHSQIGITNLMEGIGWTEVSYADAQPGDVGTVNSPIYGHAFFMWENDTIFDECMPEKNINPYHWQHMSEGRYWRAP